MLFTLIARTLINLNKLNPCIVCIMNHKDLIGLRVGYMYLDMRYTAKRNIKTLDRFYKTDAFAC